MRPSFIFIFVCLIFIVALFLTTKIATHTFKSDNVERLMAIVISELHLTDPCISTEARYTRHPSISDPIVPVMDHPGALEHFPSGSFWTPPHKWILKE